MIILIQILKSFITMMSIVMLFLLAGCRNHLANSQMMETYIENINKSDSITCFNSIHLKYSRDSLRQVNSLKKQIRDAIAFYKAYPHIKIPLIEKRGERMGGNLIDSEFVYMTKEVPKMTYVMKFSFMNFVPNKIYDFKFYGMEPYDSNGVGPQIHWTKEEACDFIKKIKPSLP